MPFKEWPIIRWFRQKSKSAARPIVEAASKTKKVILKKMGLAFVKGSGGGRPTFEGPEGFEFEEIERAYLTDSYIRTALDKYVDYMFKSGWDLVGKDLNAIEYVKQRIKAMSFATGHPTDQFFIEIAEELVKYHNVVLVKARQPNSYTYPPGLRVTPAMDEKKPVAGYFLLPISTITIARDKHGSVIKYQQEVQGQDPIEIKPSDVIHIFVDRPPGRAFGFPFLWEVLDDVKLLRQMEELVDRMVYKNIFPLIIYQVGLDREGFEATDDEIESVKETLGDLSLDGGLVVPERHNVKTVGVEGKALDVSEYLKYFERRVFTGLGVSDVIMGRGDTASRSTSDNMDAAFRDRIKAYQATMATFVNHYIVNELLMEGGFDPMMNADHEVAFRFREIDFDSKIKEENHVIQKFTQNAITHEEMRNSLSMDPVADEERLYYNMITKALNAEAAQEKAQAANNQGDNKDKPANQHGKKTSPKKKEMQESFTTDLEASLKNRWDLFKAETIDNIRRHYQLSTDEPFDMSAVEMNLELTLRSMVQITERRLQKEFYSGINKAQVEAGKVVHINAETSLEDIQRKMERDFSRLILNDLKGQLKKTTSKINPEGIVQNVSGIFEALRYRLSFIARFTSMAAQNAGFARAAREMEYEEAFLVTGEDTCEECASRQETPVQLYTDKLPPYHPNCTCRLTLKKKEGS